MMITDKIKLKSIAKKKFLQQQYSSASQIFRFLSHEHDSESIYYLGVMYLYGLGFDKDINLSKGLFQRSADLGFPESLYELGKFSFQSEDFDRSYELFNKSADLGSPRASYMMGMMTEHGIAVLADLREAFDWYKKAADKGVDIAQYCIGHMLIHGEGVDVDIKKGVSWIRKAAEQQLPEALDALAVIFDQSPEFITGSDELETVNVMKLTQQLPDQSLVDPGDFGGFLELLKEKTEARRSDWLESALQYWKDRQEP